MMRIEEALQQVDAIAALAQRGATYRGLRWQTVGATGVFGLAAAALQPMLMAGDSNPVFTLLLLWVTVAAASLSLIVADMAWRYHQNPTARSRRLTLTVLKRLSPALVVGGGLTVVWFDSATESVWMLPGLWAIVLGLGIFSTASCLPEPLRQVGIWYIGCGFALLMVMPHTSNFHPLAMAIPFGGGQLLTSALIYRYGETSLASE